MIETYLVDKITLRMDKGNDIYQEPLTPEDITVKAFIEYGEFRVQNAEGEVIVSNTKVHMKPRTIITSGFDTRAANTISYKDIIIFDNSSHAIMKLNKARDFTIRSIVAYVT